ncbi:UdgX family uracil-DNA binding protein [Salinisphaera orenii]|uniref:Type-4 uracil-DNA glycosylase n=1 Tax=Salinisphaera orenii YIM 95161 TaxID=1051139 RepID=A0A423PT95_9GAMM|nr:UdgX family uracil-DNA binding protein [Salinisphaera halophila]ROO28813.1 DNA polymerase [Salinisphaera halophila YIM 95161]
MHQPSLFGQADAAGAERTVVRFAPDFEAWRHAACVQWRAGRAPDALWWQADPAARGDEPTRVVGPRVPKAFGALARAVVCHRSADRGALLYRLLWRLSQGERHLLALAGDADVARANRYAKAVRRDAHKMKAFVRFRAVPDPEAIDGEPRYVAWFEPEHEIIAHVADFFVRRFANMRWSILTPDRCLHYEGRGRPWFSAGSDAAAAPAGDALEDAWRVYYRSIFNPARLKRRAMQSEMPAKYWKNMPEAELIPSLIAGADARVAAMEAQGGGSERLRCGPRPERPAAREAAAVARTPEASLERLQLQAAACRGCPLWRPATRTVFGEGPADARIAVVGEQPGDAEDLAGRPFVGPAGRLLDRALAEAGLDRAALYLTNAVKHFKFTPRGKARIHAKPAYREIAACRPWLDAELELLRPALVVCLGATAARTLLGRPVTVARQRGRIVEVGERACLVTFHPAHLLRSGAAGDYRDFVADLARAARRAHDGVRPV